MKLEKAKKKKKQEYLTEKDFRDRGSGAKKKAYIDPEIMDTKRILKKTGINDNTLGWAHAYIKRFPNKETTKKLIKYYLEPYGWSRYIQNSGGYGMHMSCAYADINKIK